MSARLDALLLFLEAVPALEDETAREKANLDILAAAIALLTDPTERPTEP